VFDCRKKMSNRDIQVNYCLIYSSIVDSRRYYKRVIVESERAAADYIHECDKIHDAISQFDCNVSPLEGLHNLRLWLVLCDKFAMKWGKALVPLDIRNLVNFTRSQLGEDEIDFGVDEGNVTCQFGSSV